MPITRASKELPAVSFNPRSRNWLATTAQTDANRRNILFLPETTDTTTAYSCDLPRVVASLAAAQSPLERNIH